MTRPAAFAAPWLVPLSVATALTLTGCGKPEFEKIPSDQLDPARVAAAQQFATKILDAWNKDQYPLVGDEASEEFKKGHNDVDRQKSADKSIEAALGNWKSMTLHEALRSKPPQFDVYRFEGVFERNPRAEVRVVYDMQGKVSGFWIKPWKDTL